MKAQYEKPGNKTRVSQDQNTKKELHLLSLLFGLKQILISISLEGANKKENNESLKIIIKYKTHGASLVVQGIHLPMQDCGVRSLCREDPLETETATQPRMLAWKTPPTEEPEGLQSTGCKEWGRTERLSTQAHNKTYTLFNKEL